MTDTLYLTANDVFAINEIIMLGNGQTTLLLNRGALESAVLRPQTAVYYQQAHVAEQATLLIAGIAFAHAFLDGNKRTAVVAGGAFLDRNGWRISTQGDELGRQVESMVNHADSQDAATQHFLMWLRTVIELTP